MRRHFDPPHGRLVRGLGMEALFSLVLLLAAAVCANAVSPFVRIRNAQGNAASWGSGTLIDKHEGKGLILTCQHVFGDGIGDVSVFFDDKTQYTATVIAADKLHNDLMALSIPEPHTEPAQVGKWLPGMRVHCWGYGGQGILQRFSGISSPGGRPSGASHNCAAFASNVRSGDSGGGVVNDAGELVGVVWGTEDGRASSNMTAGPALTEFLTRLCQCNGPNCWRPSPGFGGGVIMYPPQQDPPAQRPPVQTQPIAGNCECGDKWQAIDGTIAAMESTITNINSQLVDLKPALDDRKAAIGEIRDLLGQLVESFERGQQRQDESIDAATSRIGSIEERLADLESRPAQQPQRPEDLAASIVPHLPPIRYEWETRDGNKITRERKLSEMQSRPLQFKSVEVGATK